MCLLLCGVAFNKTDCGFRWDATVLIIDLNYASHPGKEVGGKKCNCTNY